MATPRSAIRAAAILAVTGCLTAIVDTRSAAAALMMRALISTDGGATFATVGSTSDGGPGDFNPNAGGLMSFYSSGGITTIMPTAIGNPMTAYPSFSVAFNASGTAAVNSILRIEYTQTDIPNSAGTDPFQTAFSMSSLSGASSVTLSSFGDPNNVAYSTNVALGSANFTASAGLDVVSSLTPSTTSPNFSGTLRVDIALLAGTAGTIGGSINVIAVPISEPMTIALFGAGLLGLAVIRRVRA